MILLIFSCNRALQLQALLDSLLLHLTVDGPLSVHIVYAASDDTYQEGYELLIKAYPALQFHQERRQRKWAWPHPVRYWKNAYRYLKHPSLRRISNFKALTEQLIANSPHEGVMFLTDDSLFTKPVYLNAARQAAVLDDADSTYSYSLRHGLSLRPLPATIQAHAAGGYVWQVQPQQATMGHWTWRFSVDGHLYPRRALLPILRRLHYANPNSLEGFVNEYISNVRPDLFSSLLFEAHSSLVGFILNKVQTYNGNRSFDVSPAFLNEKLLNGYQLHYRYQQPVTDFHPDLQSIELVHTASGERNILKIA